MTDDNVFSGSVANECIRTFPLEKLVEAHCNVSLMGMPIMSVPIKRICLNQVTWLWWALRLLLFYVTHRKLNDPILLRSQTLIFVLLTACVWQIGVLKSFSQVWIPELAGWVCSSCRTLGLSKAFSSVAEMRCQARSYFIEITLITMTTFSFVPKIHLWKP